MPRHTASDKDSRQTMAINGASVGLGALAVWAWLAASPDLPDLVRTGATLIVASMTLAFVAAVVHRAMAKTDKIRDIARRTDNILVFPGAA